MTINKASSPLFTLEEAANYLRVGRSTLYRMIDAGSVTPVRLVGRKPLFHQDDLDELIGKCRNSGGN